MAINLIAHIQNQTQNKKEQQDTQKKNENPQNKTADQSRNTTRFEYLAKGSRTHRNRRKTSRNLGYENGRKREKARGIEDDGTRLFINFI